MSSDSGLVQLQAKDYGSDQDVRWCPGCGDYAILAGAKKVLAALGAKRENTVFVSGIGCSSRFPYYMNTYGFHSIHGRAPAVATGIKATNPELDVWIVTGDGDGLSIGGNHLLHIIRRNVNCNILLFNNRIYGLTKGQYSPTSPIGQRTKSSPMGSVDQPFNPLRFALGCGATFVARTIDTHQKHMAKTLEAAAHHKGTAFVEVMQNCVIFNKDFYADWADKSVRSEKTVDLEPGKPLVFGKENERGLSFADWEPVITEAANATVWDPTQHSAAPAFALSTLDQDPAMPTPIGIFRSVAAPTYEDAANSQVESAIGAKGQGQLRDLIYAGDMWTVG